MIGDNLLKYIKGVFDTEISLYVQQKNLNDMRTLYSRLATGLTVAKPQKRQNPESISDSMVSTAKVCAIIVAILIALLFIFDNDEPLLLRLLLLVPFSAAVGLVMGFIAGLAIGIFVGIIRVYLCKKRIEKIYQNDLEQYEKDLSKDRLRLSIEQKKKDVLGQEIAKAERQMEITRQNLKNFYSYNIVDPAYRNLAAIGTFYNYLSTKRTFSLSFDQKTGDQGAYNIYESERRLDILITNTEEILDRLDDLAYSQHQLAAGLRDANAQINYMRGELNHFASQTVNSLDQIKQIESVTAYNTDCIKRQTEIMNWLTFIRY